MEIDFDLLDILVFGDESIKLIKTYSLLVLCSPATSIIGSSKTAEIFAIVLKDKIMSTF